MESFNAEKGFGGDQLSSSKLGLKEESGTCTACAPLVSPCVHSEQLVSTAKKANGFFGEACLRNADLSSTLVSIDCNDRQHTSSETSHPLSVCLSHESFSENAESEETLRDCKTCEGCKMIIKQNQCLTCANNCGLLKGLVICDKVVSNQLEKQKESECLEDNISFICEADYAKTRASDHNSDADKKNESYSSASVDSFPGTEKAVNGRPACFLAGSPCVEVDDNHPKRSNRSSNEFSQEILCCSSKSDFSEISSLRDSCAVASLAKGEHSECSEEQVQSSFARAAAVQAGSRIADEHNSAESVEVDTGTNKGEQTTEVKTTVVKEINMQETTIGSRPAACSDGSDNTEYEVKVCDICGDIGREEMLAICSKCNDGAEHIYCMHVKMDNVPTGDWMCEECVMSKETEKQKQDKLDGVRIFKRPCTSESEAKGLEVEESKAHKVSSTPSLTSKRPAGSLQTVRKALGTVLKSPITSSSSSKASTHQSGGLSSSTTVKTVCIPAELSSKSPKLSSQYQASRGFLSKSKSLSAVSLKEDVQQPKEGSFCNEGFAKESAASASEGRVHVMSKSMSLTNIRSYTVNNSNHDIKLLHNFSHGEDLKRSRHPKGQDQSKTEKKLRLANSDSFAAMADERIASPGKNRLAYPSSSSCHDLMAVKGHEISDNSLKISSNYVQRGSLNEEKESFVNVRHHVEYSTEVVPAISKKHSNATVHSDKRPCLRDLSMFASEVHMHSWTSAVPQLDYIWQGKFETQRSGELPFICDGLQAHLSSCASHKVLEVVQKLPQKLLLEEAPRLSMWPTQFMESHATEDNIALYFFAKEIHSYEGSYKNLLDRMSKNDFSLKGNFGGFELLIFSSSLLPEKSQRWNNLLFLWGVFRGKRDHGSGQISAVSASENFFPPGKSSQSFSASLVSCNDTQQTLNADTLLDLKTVTSGRMVEVCETKASSREGNPPALQTSGSQQVGRVDLSQREERESKRRPEIDLNCSLQESQKYFGDCTEADVCNNRKRLKSCFSGMNLDSNRIKDMKDGRSIAVNGKGPSSFGEFKHVAACYTSIVSPESDAVGDKYSWKPLQQQQQQQQQQRQQVLSKDSGNQLNSSVSNLELVLGVGRSSSDHRNMPSFSMLMGNKDSEGVIPERERETSGDDNPSLALSLALPCTKTGDRKLKLGSETKLPKCPEVNTTLSLLGVSSDF